MDANNAATTYGYANARVKAMESKLVGKDTIAEMQRVTDIPSLLAILLQTDYKDSIEEFGGVGSRARLIDFALNKNLAQSLEKLARVTPDDDKYTITRLVGRWDVHNIKMVIYALANRLRYEDISEYLISSPSMSEAALREALSEHSVEAALSKLEFHAPQHKREILAAHQAYRKTSNLTEVNAAIDRESFNMLGETITELESTSREAAYIIKLDITMRNVLTLLRAKRYSVQTDQVRQLLIDHGVVQTNDLITAYDSNADVGSLASTFKVFDLKDALAAYEASQSKRMIFFEISMRNEIFKRALSLLRHSVLSFNVLIGFLYLKEIEVSTIRVIANSKAYGLEKAEIDRMIGWQM